MHQEKPRKTLVARKAPRDFPPRKEGILHPATGCLGASLSLPQKVAISSVELHLLETSFFTRQAPSDAKATSFAVRPRSMTYFRIRYLIRLSTNRVFFWIMLVPWLLCCSRVKFRLCLTSRERNKGVKKKLANEVVKPW